MNVTPSPFVQWLFEHQDQLIYMSLCWMIITGICSIIACCLLWQIKSKTAESLDAMCLDQMKMLDELKNIRSQTKA
jgi:hypothetical protein